MIYPFSEIILTLLEKYFGKNAKTIFEISPLLGYISEKTQSANRGSKSRSSFASLYSLYVLIKDYIDHGFDKKDRYSEYEGADFSRLLKSMRDLPFGGKLQNHALNNRVNAEFHKFYKNDNRQPIIHKVDTRKYWINESLLIVQVSGLSYNIANAILDIINAYIAMKQESFNQFIHDCEALKKTSKNQDDSLIKFIRSLIAPEKDARIFEIVSYAILRAFYAEQIIFIGETIQTAKPQNLHLFKTGRTNANDGGIDFVMKPLGRFFQVTETLDVKKYFLDIDKIEKFPISFVIKTNMSIDDIRKHLEAGAREQYTVENIVKKYMESIEEIINIPQLIHIFDNVIKTGNVHYVLEEIISWSKLEFNYMDDNADAGFVTDDDEDE